MYRNGRIKMAMLAAGTGSMILFLGIGAGRIQAMAGSEHPALEGDLDVPCAECHADLIEEAVVHSPAAEGECEACHEFTPVDVDVWRVSFTLPEEELCLECHTDQEEELQRGLVHGAVPAFGCSSCHSPHQSTLPRLLRKSGNALCLDCHQGTSDSRPLDDDGNVVLFGKLIVPASSFDKIQKLDLPGELLIGHPVSKHPTQGDRDPNRPETAFWCGSCHEPHASVQKNLLIGGEGFSFCRQCHKK